MFLKFAVFTGKRLYWILFLVKLQALRPINLLKKASAWMFFCKYCGLFKKILFKEHHWWLLLYLKFNWNLIIQIGKLMAYIFNKIISVSIMYFFIFSLSVLLKLLKHVKAGLKKLFACRPWVCGEGWSVETFILMRVSLVSRALPLFDVSLVAGRTFIRNYCYNR